MATPITAGAGLWELRKIITGEAGVDLPLVPLVGGHGRGLAGRRPRSPSPSCCASCARTATAVFVVYRIALAAVVVVAWLGLWDR